MEDVPKKPDTKTAATVKAKGKPGTKLTNGRQKKTTDKPQPLGRNERRLLDSDAVAKFEEI